MKLARGFLVGFYAVVYVLSQLVDTLEDMEREAKASMDVMLISWQIYLEFSPGSMVPCCSLTS